MQNQNIINNKFKFPSLRSASSQLDKILEGKERAEALQKQKSYENSDLFYNEHSLNNLNSKIRMLKKYELDLNLKNSRSHDNKINRIQSNQLLASLQNQNLSTTLGLPNGEVSNSFTKSNKNHISIFSLNKNKAHGADLINKDKSLVSLQEMSLPLAFYPNVNPDLGNKGILDLKLNTVKRYINVFSKFNSEIATFQNIDYKFSSGHNHSIKNINTILESLFRRFFALISKPNFDISATKVGLRIFYLLVEPKPKNENKTTNKKTKNSIKNKTKGNFVKDLFRRGESFKLKQLELLGNLLIKLYNKPVEFEITKLVKPYNDSTILSKSLGMLSNSVKYTSILYKFLKNAKFKNPTKMFRKTEEKSLQSISTVPAFLSGVKVRVGGRLLTQSVIPRRTVSIYQRGCLARGKADFVNTARFTNKNKRGSYSITVSVASFSAV
jgi:hypothetical protein